jgi:glycosyltransferase involved in cell wall biosynthesis
LAQELSSAQQFMERQQTELIRLAQEKGEAAQRAATLESVLAQLRGELSEARARISEQDGQIAALNQAVVERDESAKELAVKLQAQETRTEELEIKLDKREAELETSKARSKELAGAVTSLEVRLGARVKELDDRAREVKALRHDTKSLKAQLSAVYVSHSWRITRPLRATAVNLRRLGGLGRLARVICTYTMTKGPRASCRLFKERFLFLSSGAFDVDYYLRQNPDVARTRTDPALHYLLYGAGEGRDPNPLFDTDWYLTQNPDVAEAGANPLAHFLRFGANEGRDPRPPLVSSAYLAVNADVSRGPANPLVRYLKLGTQEGHSLAPQAENKSILTTLSPSPNVTPSGSSGSFLATEMPMSTVSGQRAWMPSARTVVLCGHAAGHYLYGGERSLLDIAEALTKCQFNVVAVLPRNNHNYTSELQKWCHSIQIFPYGWWKRKSSINEIAVNTFAKVFRENHANAIHVNTIVLREPLLAAKRLSIPSIVHVRELIELDKDMIDIIGEPPRDIVRKIMHSADYIVANSATTAKAFSKPGRTFIVLNAIDISAFDFPNIINPNAVRFALISSNIRKKGLYDFLELARLCQSRAPQARFIIVGPESNEIKEIRGVQGAEIWPANLSFTGYKSSPPDAVAEANVVCNLSHFGESFGRSLLEGMAAGRPVIAYEWGALPELVHHGNTGFLVPYRQPAAAIEFVERLAANPDMIVRMGNSGRRVACECYSKTKQWETLRGVYDAVFRDVRSTERRGTDETSKGTHHHT